MVRPSLWISGGMACLQAMGLELVEQATGLGGFAGSIEVTYALFDAIGDGDLGLGIAELEQ